MSVSALTWAFNQKIPASKGKGVLVALANYADSHFECHPSQNRLSDMTGYGLRALNSHLKCLEENGFIARTERRNGRGHRTSDAYKLLVFQDAKSAGRENDDADNEDGSLPAKSAGSLHADSAGSLHADSARTYKDDTKKKDTKGVILEREFDEFCAVAINLIQKPRTRSAYCKARLRASHDDIMAGWKAANALWRKERREKKFIPSPANWLNNDCWNDDIGDSREWWQE